MYQAHTARIPLIDVLRTYIRNTQITPLDSRAAQKQSRDCSNNQQTNQMAIYAHFQRSQRVTAPNTGPCKGCRRRFQISETEIGAKCEQYTFQDMWKQSSQARFRYEASQQIGRGRYEGPTSVYSPMDSGDCMFLNRQLRFQSFPRRYFPDPALSYVSRVFP